MKVVSRDDGTSPIRYTWAPIEGISDLNGSLSRELALPHKQPYLYGGEGIAEAHLRDPDLLEAVRLARPLSMIPQSSLVDMAWQVSALLRFDIPGDFVECGVWSGGTSFLMADILRRKGVNDRRVWMFDSYEGYPESSEADGDSVRAYSEATDSIWYLDNCRASLDKVVQNADRLGLAELVRPVPGWFNQTLPATREEVGPIALLRIDGNWYESDKCCLENLYDQVVDGGLITVNTYYTYEGSALALHEFFGERGIHYPIEPVLGPAGDPSFHLAAVFRKGGSTWKWMMRTAQLLEAIQEAVPAGASFVLVDEARFGHLIDENRHSIPFREKDGEYRGLPADESEAVNELRRQEERGARHVVIAWPCFWCLEHYDAFRGHLGRHYESCIAEDSCRIFQRRS